MLRPTMTLALLAAPSLAWGQAAGLDSGTSCSFATIQDAIDAASPGDTVYVSPGTFNEHLYINKSIDLMGGANSTCTGLTGSDRTTLGLPPGPNIHTTLVIDSTSGVFVHQFDIENGQDLQHGGNATVYDSTSVVFDDVTLSGGSAPTHGGNLYVKGGSVTLDGTTVSRGSSAEGGGVAVVDAGLTLMSSEIVGNTAARGGGLYLQGDVSMGCYLTAFDGSLVGDNVASEDGGGVHALGSTVIVAGDGPGLFVLRNDASLNGGGLYMNAEPGVLTPLVDGVVFEDNTADGDGGGLYLTTDYPRPFDITVLDATVLNNTATNGGGLALAADATTAVGVYDTHFEGNIADDEGGGAWVDAGSLHLESTATAYIMRNGTSTMFIDNSAYTRGGGLFSHDDVVMQRVGFHNNDTHNANGTGPHEIGNFGNLDATNLFVMGDGGMSVRTFAGGNSDFRHFTLDGGTVNTTILRYDSGSTGSVIASIVEGGRVREWVTGDLDARCSLFTNTPTGTYLDTDSCIGTGCLPDYYWNWKNDYTPSATSIARDACAAYSGETTQLMGIHARDASPDMGAFEY